MSSNNNNTRNNKIVCKVCKDANKPESTYTSHYVKDKCGNVVCPTLLSLECRFCHGKGHTVKFCMKLDAIKKQEQRENEEKKQQKEHPQNNQTLKKKNYNNIFE